MRIDGSLIAFCYEWWHHPTVFLDEEEFDWSCVRSYQILFYNSSGIDGLLKRADLWHLEKAHNLVQ